MQARTPTSRSQRRLAAIFCADVAGYTRLMNADEGSTFRSLTAHREITDRLIAQHAGRIANTAGDSVLAEFASVVDALQCALAMQERIAAVNADVAEERQITFRIGLHVGEVIVRDGDLFGDGVNVAARMQALAEPGAVCLSGTAHDYVDRTLGLSFEDLGPQRVKNLDKPIQAYMTRPAAVLSRPLPQVHRRLETYLARRFNDECQRALSQVTEPEDLTPLEPPILAWTSGDCLSGLASGATALGEPWSALSSAGSFINPLALIDGYTHFIQLIWVAKLIKGSGQRLLPRSTV
jgi:adenylate cyclase